jgi:hypothetical protein
LFSGVLKIASPNFYLSAREGNKERVLLSAQALSPTISQREREKIR